MSEVTAVIGNHQGERHLPECLASLARQTHRPVEVIVVDAESTDRSREVAEAAGARFLPAQNRGLGHLYNVGARGATAPFILLANNDVSFDDRCLEQLASALDADATLFAADPRQLDWAGERVVHGHVRLRRGPFVRQPLPGFALDLTAPAARPVVTVQANAGAMLVRRHRLLVLGGFDETFFLDFEDLDLCWRAWLRGWGSVYVPGATLRHRVGATSGHVRTRRLVNSHHNLVRFALKCLPPGPATRVVAGELLRLPAHPRIVPPALLTVLRTLPQVMRLRAELRPDEAVFDWILRGQPG